MTTEKEQLEKLREWLEQNRGEYLGAQTVLQDPQQVRSLFKSLIEKTQTVMKFDAYKHPAEAAVAEVSRMQERLVGVFSDIDFLEQYEDKRDEYHALVRASAGVELDALSPLEL